MVIDTSALLAILNYEPYALAKITGEPILFKGDDFSQTDIQPVIK
jgi:uncharacterized protein with PIN domain